MSKFGDKLNELMASAKMTSDVLAVTAQVSEGTISKLRNGLQTWCSPEHFEKLATTLSSDVAVHAELLQAYLFDQCRGPGAELLSITIGGKRPLMLSDSPASDLARLPADVRADLLIVIKEAEFDRDVRDVIHGVANLVAPERIGAANSDPAAQAAESEAVRIAKEEISSYRKSAKKKRAK